MKRKSLLIMLLVALFVPLAMNGQTRTAKNSIMDSAKAEMNAQNEMLTKSPVYPSNLESGNFNMMAPSNDRGNRDASYELVTASQSDWSGNYVLVGPWSSTTGYAFDGTVSNNLGGITAVTIDGNSLSSIGDAPVLTIAKSTYDNSYYSIRINGGDYLTDGTSGLETSSTETEYYWNITYTSNGMQIYCPKWSGGPYYLYFVVIQNTSTSGYAALFATCQEGDLSFNGYNTLEYDFPVLYKETGGGSSSGNCEDFESYASSANTNISNSNGTVPSGWGVSGNTGNYRPHLYNGSYSVDGVGIVFTSGSSNYGGTDSYLYSNIILHEGDEVSFNTYTEGSANANRKMYYGYWKNNAFQSLGEATTVQYSASGAATQGVTTFTVTNAADGYPLAWRWYVASSYWSAVIDNVCVTSASSSSCDYAIPYTYGFEDASDFNCWTKVNCETCSSNSSMYGLYNNSSYAHTGSKLFIFSSYCGETDPQYLISPELSGVVNGVHVEFYYENCGFSTAPETFQVGYSTTDNNVNSFTWVDSKSNTAQTYQHFTANYMGQVKYVAVKYTSADSYYLYLDDFLFEEAPSCLEPTNIVASNETTTSATISWTAGGSETEWDLYYTTNPSDVPSASTAPSISSITTNSQNLTGLNPASTYYVYLRSVCGGSESSAWSVPGIFNTECYAMTLPYSYGFEDGALSVCWTPIIGNPVYMSIEVSDADPRTGTYHLNLDRRTPDGIQIIVLPEVDGAYALNNCEVSFYAKLSAGGSSNYTTTGRTLAVGVMTDPNDASTFVQVGNAVTPTASYAKYTFDLSSYTGNGQYIAIKHDESSSGNNGYTYIDDLEVTTAAIPVSSITADPVTVTVGQTANITNLVVLPADATNPAVTYTSNDETIATVENGVVTGVAVGTTTITIAATDGSGVTATINVTVNGIDVTGITAENVTVVTGETATISYIVAPTNATDASVTFTSANTAIATVDADGVVTGVSVGETTITIASVSNPEVTATITVTVTSNPNAVQFTVNAPAYAQPGDVITVDFKLATPTTGTYTGFTGLDVNLYFETAAFQYNSKANGAVADAVSDIDMGQVSISGPNTNNPNRVKALLSTPANHPVTAEGIVFSATFTVLQDVALGSYTFNAEINEFDYTTGEIGNSNTVDIPYEFTPSTVTIAEQYTLPIIGYDTEAAHGTLSWYLIASPIGTIANDNLEEKVTNIFSNSYDLYYFNQSGKQGDDYVEWINYKPENGTYQATGANFDLVRGKGYLYANSQTVDLVFNGFAPSTENFEVTLAYDADARFAGWNLVGNPYAVPAYFTTDRDFYTMNSAGTSFEVCTDEERSIEAMAGVFVIATSNNESLTFTTQPTKQSRGIVLKLSEGRSNTDAAIVRFGEGRTLPKLQLFEGSTKIYIPQDGQDFAVVRSEEMGEMPVNFKAESNGTYSLNVSGQNTEFAYLHLIDNMTGNDVDLLDTPSYSFEAKTTDYESRFKLVYATGNASDDTFAFFSNGSFVINNEGNAELQVVDVMGRIVKSESINGCANVSVNGAAGVYMLRLINGDNVKVQKVVVK